MKEKRFLQLRFHYGDIIINFEVYIVSLLFLLLTKDLNGNSRELYIKKNIN